MPVALKRFLLISVLMLISLLVFAYPWQRLFLWSPDLPSLPFPAIITFWLLPIILFIIWMKFRTPVSAVFGQISVNWLGISIMFMWAAIFTEIVNLTGLITNQKATLIMIFLGLCLCIYGVYKATRIEISNQSIQSEKLNQSYKVAHLSDIHLGSRSSNFVNKVIQKTNKLEPDLIFITGDLIDMRKVKPEALRIMKGFNAPVFFIKGNHDRYISSNKHFEVIDQTGVVTLDNHYHEHQDLQIIGIADTADPKQLQVTLPKIKVNENKFSVLLYHKPENFELVAKNKIDLMLSGHTHAGQMFPFNFVVKKQFPYLKGLFKIDSSHLYVSQGTGTWGPVMRLGTNNEITVFNLEPTQTKQ